MIALACLLSQGCSAPNPQNADHTNMVAVPMSNDSKTRKAQTIEATPFHQTWLEWQGTPYLFGGNSSQGIDCSAFIQVAIQQAFNVALPRTTSQQIQQGNEINWHDKQVGDLLFFKTGSRTLHVGIYLGQMQFLHASTSKGVIISRLDSPYWAEKLLKIKRVA